MRVHLRRNTLPLILMSLGLCHWAVAADSVPSPDARAPEVSASWVTAIGTVAPHTRGGFRTKWVWSEPKPGLPEGNLALRVALEVKFPGNWTFARATSDKAELVRIDKVPNSKDPLLRQVIIDQTAAVAVVDFEFVHIDGSAKSLSLVLTADYRKPFIVTKKECLKYTMKLEPITEAGRHLFIGFSCTEDEKNIHLSIIRSEDAKWDSATLEKNGPQPAFTHKIAKPQEDLVYETRVVKISTRDSNSNRIEYAVSYSPKIKPRRWDLGVGLAGTYFRYSEVLQRLNLNQRGLTAKGSFIYRIIPKLLTADFTAFGTVFSYGTVPEGRPGVRFIGLNGRLGYRLPVELGATEWFFLAGWYTWLMLVSEDSALPAYGINALSGPQIFIQMVRAKQGSLPYYVYGKFATVSDTSDFIQLENKELAIGAGIGLYAAPKPVMVTLDLARTQFAAGRNALVLDTVSVGVSKRL